jgi:hypothetical protein
VKSQEWKEEHFQKGLDSLKDVYLSMLVPKVNQVNEANEVLSTQSSSKSESHLDDDKSSASQASSCVYSEEELDKKNVNNEFNLAPFISNKKVELINEIKEFNLILQAMNLEKKQMFTTKSFWEKYEIKMPNLFELALLLTHIPPSSSFIERFFSVCGIVKDKRQGNMSSNLLEMRSQLKANLSYLQLTKDFFKTNIDLLYELNNTTNN